jgi:hypothetical protein
VRFSVEGTDAKRPEGLKAPALVQYIERLVAATNAADLATLTALLEGAEDPGASAAALIEHREAGGSLAPAVMAIVYPNDLEEPVEITVSVWRNPDADGSQPEDPSPWVTLELTAHGKVGVLSLDRED